jgi:hypothetical protein
MDPILQVFLSWQFIIFAVAIMAVVHVIRMFAEYGLSNWKPLMKESKLWNDLIMPILPIVVGVLGALVIKSYPYPNNLTATGSRFIFGLGAGMLASTLFRFVMASINQKIHTIIQQDPAAAIAAAAAEKNAKSSSPVIPAAAPPATEDKGMSAGAVDK